MERNYRDGDRLLHVAGTRDGAHLRLTTETGDVEFTWDELAPGDYLLRRNGEQRRCLVARLGEERWVWIDGRVHHLVVASARPGADASHAAGDLLAPMPGQVLKVMIQVGESVRKNQPLLVLEAMKMQYEIVAPRDGVIARVLVPEGAQVQGGAMLVALDEDGTP